LQKNGLRVGGSLSELGALGDLLQQLQLVPDQVSGGAELAAEDDHGSEELAARVEVQTVRHFLEERKQIIFKPCRFPELGHLSNKIE
jgi:hypothetical protein